MKSPRLYQPWTLKEIEEFTNLYPYTPNYELSEVFGRSVRALITRANQLGLKKTKKATNKTTKPKRVIFTSYEKDYILKFYGQVPRSVIAEKLNRSEGVIRQFHRLYMLKTSKHTNANHER